MLAFLVFSGQHGMGEWASYYRSGEAGWGWRKRKSEAFSFIIFCCSSSEVAIRRGAWSRTSNKHEWLETQSRWSESIEWKWARTRTEWRHMQSMWRESTRGKNRKTTICREIWCKRWNIEMDANWSALVKLFEQYTHFIVALYSMQNEFFPFLLAAVIVICLVIGTIFTSTFFRKFSEMRGQNGETTVASISNIANNYERKSSLFTIFRFVLSSLSILWRFELNLNNCILRMYSNGIISASIKVRLMLSWQKHIVELKLKNLKVFNRINELAERHNSDCTFWKKAWSTWMSWSDWLWFSVEFLFLCSKLREKAERGAVSAD